ncbi:cation:proton antiporter, partial [Methylobacterium frigidaeris]
LQRLHTVTFVNVAGGAAIVLATWLTDGLTPRALKCTAIWLATLLVGALLSHVTGHALHIRDGERR